MAATEFGRSSNVGDLSERIISDVQKFEAEKLKEQANEFFKCM